MATYVNDLRLKEIATGDESGTWGTSTNTNLSLIADAFSYATKDCFATDADATETMADGSADEIRSLYLKVTSSATLTATRTLTLAPNTVSKVWIIENATTGSQSIDISQGSGANVTIPNGDVKVIYTDGAGAGAAVVDAFTDLNVSGITVDGGTIKLDGDYPTGTQNNALGNTALDSLTSGQENVAIGSASLTAVTSGQRNVGVGVSTLETISTANFNTALGHAAARDITGSGNTALGDTAMVTATTGDNNTAVGHQSLKVNTASNNTAVGFYALLANTTGGDNVSVGTDSLRTNTTGGANSALGKYALYSNTTANYNVGVGYNSLYANTTGSANVAVGSFALDANTTGASNTAIGYVSLSANTTGIENTSLGYASLRDNTTGVNNNAFGQSSLRDCTTGSYNTAVGSSALLSITSGNNNVAVGHIALSQTTTGFGNVAMGIGAVDANTTSSYNTGIGNDALTASTSSGNTALGANAGDSTVTTGDYNILIGAFSELGGAGQENQIVIGSAATGKGSNTGFITPNGGAMYQGNNSSSWSTVSDRRIKKNIVDNTTGLDAINQIQVRNFEYKSPEEISEGLTEKDAVKKEGLQVGVIAQEIEAILPDVVTDLESGCKSVNPDNLTWYLVNAVKELSAKCDSLQNEINILKGE